MRTRGLAVLAALLLCRGPAAAAPETQTPPVRAEAAPPSCPEDLGPSEIDVSSYPEEHQKTYRETFLPVFEFFGTAARMVNSPLVELDPALEEAEARLHPDLFSDPLIARATRDGWRREIAAIHRRPPCCGACPVLTLDQARALWRFMVYDSLARKTGDNAEKWIAHRRSLMERFRALHPDRMETLYSDSHAYQNTREALP